MSRVGVLLSGCGHLDGSEIQEAVLALYFLDQAGADVTCFALDVQQLDVVDHLTQEPIEQNRNQRIEAARLARGQVQSLANADVSQLDALIFPGGFGVAKNLSDFISKGKDYTVLAEVASLVEQMHMAQKSMGFICIAPIIAARLIPDVSVTTGSDAQMAATIEAMGAKHIVCDVCDIAVDQVHKIVSTPAYMYGKAGIADVAKGIEKLVTAVLALV